MNGYQVKIGGGGLLLPRLSWQKLLLRRSSKNSPAPMLFAQPIITA